MTGANLDLKWKKKFTEKKCSSPPISILMNRMYTLVEELLKVRLKDDSF